MRVGVIGTGHVGLITCVSFASLGHDVVGTDADEEKIAKLKDGSTPFFEPGLQEGLLEEMKGDRLTFTSDPAEAIAGSEVVFICVGTPPRADGEANLVAVEQAALTVARHATGPVVLIEKSTVPTGTAKRLDRTLRRERPDLDGLQVVSNPEFLREGHALEDSLNPDRIVVGAETEDALETMKRLYKPLIDKGAPFVAVDINTAELSKHASNAFLALKISFANALARLCEKADADVVAVADVMGMDARIGRPFLNAGLGWGGSCFPKDLQAFERLSSRLGYQFPMLREVSRINEEAIDSAVDKVRDALWNLEDKHVALLGLSFKPGTDDVRFSPALTVARRLMAEGATVSGFDPEATEPAVSEVPGIQAANDPYEAARGAHCVVLCTEWDVFKEIDFAKLKEVMAYPVLVDGRNVYDPETMRAAGFSYYPMGRPHLA